MKKLLFGLLAFATVASAAPVINEFVAENQHGITDVDGAHSDWVEIYNPDPTPVNLSGYFLTDDSLAPTKWAFPSVTLNSGQFLVVFASGKNRAVAGSELHTNFSLNAAGGYIALVQSPGAGAVSAFTYTRQRDGYSYGISRTQGNANLIGGVTPTYLVPANAGALPVDWNAVTPTGGSWTNGTTTGGIGYDTSPPPAPTTNAARLPGVAVAQSSDLAGYPATNANDGATNNFTHTSGAPSDPNAWWRVTFPSDQTLSSLLIYNRGDGCCGGRLRDITVQILDAADTPLWTSALLNPNNVLNAPTTIPLDLIGLTGGTVTGRKVKVTRTGNPALGGAHDSYTLSLGEVVANAVIPGGPTPDFNIAPNGAASETSTGAGAPGNGINNNFTDFTHTNGTDTNPRWTLNLGGRKKLNNITIHNRSSCCGSRLRDIVITVRDSDNTTVLFTSPLLNPENQGFAYPNGPATLSLDISALYGGAVVGQYIEIKRIPDPDLSGSAGQGNADESNVLSLGEVVVSGNDFTSYAQLIGTDVKTPMYNVNTSAFVRYPFTVAPGTVFDTLKLIARYDDGFVAYIDGVKVAEANAPASPAWNAAATGGDRSDTLGTRFEVIDLAAHIPLLTAGNHVLAIQGLTSAVNDPDFLFHARLEATSQTINGFASHLGFPTPGGHNFSPWYLDFVGDTSFSVKRGFFTTAQSVAITCLTPSSQIYYTTNGDEPTPLNGTLYTAPINVAATTVLRARAFRTDWAPSNTDTQTYLFLSDVLGQQPTGTPPAGWPTSPIPGANQTMVYGMDQNVRTLYGDTQMIAALTQIPSISIVTNQANLTDTATGIYANALQHGEDWERAASIEWLDSTKPAGFQGEFQHNCGLRIRGGYSRNPQYAKHSFRIYFRDSYSVGKLDYPIFGDAGTSEHDVIDLASSQNYSWVLGDGNDTMVRDPFARQTLIDCGSPGSRTKYFHLYLNGIYWGLYWFDERPSGGFGEAYFGGSKDDWDIVKTGNHIAGFATEATDGYYDQMPNPLGGTMDAPWRTLWLKHRAFATAPGVTQSGNPDLAAYFEMLGRNADGTRNPALPVLVNEDSLIDYMLCIFYTGDGDAPLSSFLGNVRANNWFAMRSRVTDQGFIFINHDAEHTLGAGSSQNDRTGPWNSTDATFNQNNLSYSNPQWIFQDLCFSPEFRMRVADRAHKHLFNGGAMTPAVAQARMDALSAKINLAVKGHSMRWGDTAHSPAYNATDWQNAVTGARNYLANRHTTIVSQLRAYNLTTSYGDGTAPLYPLTTAPTFSQHGGNVAGGYNLTITAPAGTIYYTTNGTDPRAIGGAIVGTTYGGPLTITQPTITVKSRARSAGGEWSALTEATFFADVVPASSANIVFSEIHYHPAAPALPDITDSDEFEFLELMNISASSVNLTGAYFATGIDYTFPTTVIAPGGRLILARNAAKYTERYGGAPYGIYTGRLSNSGENLTLRAADMLTDIRSCTYGVVAPWPTETDGFGLSLVLRNPTTNPNHSLATSWRASASVTPGGTDFTGYAAWKTANGISSDSDDSDGDGLTSLLEYALSGSPTAGSLAQLPTTVRNPDGTFTFTLRRALAADDVVHTIQETNSLSTPFGPSAATLLSRTAAGSIETFVYSIPASADAQRFFRAHLQVP